jgi:hypothetical protein
MRNLGIVILALAGIVLAVAGWLHLWPLFRSAAWLAWIGWLFGILGVGLLAGRRRRQGSGRFVAGLIAAAVGLALLSVPSDGRGLFTGLQVGYAGALLAIVPHSWRLYRHQSRPDEDSVAREREVGR